MREKVMNSPEWREALANNGKILRAAKYAPFYKSATVSPAAIAGLQEAMAQANVDADQLPDAQLHDILGDPGYQEFKDFNQILPAFMVADSIAADASVAGVALSNDQMDQLARILAANFPAHQPALSLDLIFYFPAQVGMRS